MITLYHCKGARSTRSLWLLNELGLDFELEELLDDHLAEREYLLRSGFSAIDTSVGFSVVLGRNFVPTDEFSNLTAYYERCAARPAFQKSL